MCAVPKNVAAPLCHVFQGMSQVFDRIKHGFLKRVFPGNAFTPQPVEARALHL
jgi:hypothetical protein